MSMGLILQWVLPVLGTSILAFIVLFIRGVYAEKKRNTVQEIEFTGSKIHFKDNHDPINNLIDAANEDLKSRKPGDES